MKKNRQEQESVEEFLSRGGKVKTIKTIKPKDSGKYGAQKWRYKVNDVKPYDPEVQNAFKRKK